MGSSSLVNVRCLSLRPSTPSPSSSSSVHASSLKLLHPTVTNGILLSRRKRVYLSSVVLNKKTSFFNGGVEALQGSGICNGFSNRSRPVGRGRGALGARMNLFDRLARVVRSYANALLSSVEDPEKILEQAVLEMNDDLTKMRQATAQVLASQKRLENKYKAAEQASDEWYRRAQLALSKGDEDLAREALKRRKSYADNAASLKSQLEQQKNVVDNLVSNTKLSLLATVKFSGGDGGHGGGDGGHGGGNGGDSGDGSDGGDLLESKIQEARSKKDTLKARAQSAKTATKVNEMLGNINTSSALSAFEKMEEKVLAMESQAEALNQLSTDDLDGKFALLESSSVDDDLAKLKKELTGSSMRGELPAGRSAVSSSSSSSFPFRDSEIERELNELRRKAKDF